MPEGRGRQTNRGEARAPRARGFTLAELLVAVAAEADSSLRQLEENPAWDAAVGGSTAQSLGAHVADARAEATEWFRTRDPGTGVRAGTAQYLVYELIEFIE